MRLYHALKIEGLLPERAILRLRRAGIPLYKVQKTQKNAISLQVEKKDIEKVFAIYPKLCYNGSNQSAYLVTDLGSVGVAKALAFCKNRAGFLLGALAFAILTLSADSLVLGVEVVGYPAYERECKIALAESGVKPYALYPKGREEEITAKLLALPGVEFSSVQKIGNRVRVEIRYSPFQTNTLQKESMTAERGGTLVDLTVLRGAPLKKTGETVQAGEPLVGKYFTTEEGEQVCVEPIARARIACAYEGIHEAESEEQAFAEGYLQIGVAADELIEKRIEKVAEGYLVKLRYLYVQTVNL